jgi:hypothetical protein
MTWTNPDETVCDCGHPRKSHSMSLRGHLICMFRHPKTDEPCPCYDFTITVPALEHLPGRLTEEDVIARKPANS